MTSAPLLDAALARALWRGQWRAQPGRLATAVLAIAIGVALALSIHLVNRSALAEFGRAIAQINGEAQLQVKAASGDFDERLFETVLSVPGVALASPIVETEVTVEPPTDPRLAAGLPTGSSPPRPRLKVIGLDVFTAGAITPELLPSPGASRSAAGAAAPDRTDADDEGSGSPLFADDTVFVSPAAAAALGLSIGDPLTLRVGIGRYTFRVAGTVAAADGTALAVTDLGTLQWRLGWIGRLTRIDLRLAEGASPAQVAERLRARLPPEVVVTTPQAAQQRMSNLSRAYRVNLNVLALVALFTGGFIVWSTLALAVSRQAGELALLRTLGASRATLAALVLGQGAILGTLGAALGVAAGIGLAATLLTVVGGDLGSGFFSGARPALEVGTLAPAGFGLLGLLTALAGSLRPAAIAASIAPARGLRAGAIEEALRTRTGARAALVFAALGLGLLALPPVDGLPLAAYAAIACWLLAGIVAVPALMRGLAALLAPALHRAPGGLRHPVPWLALARITQAPGSAGLALGGVVASFALATAMAVMVSSFRDSVDSWLAQVLPAPLYARADGQANAAALTPELEARLRALPGVERLEFLRSRELVLDPRLPSATLLARPVDAAAPQRVLPVTGAPSPAPAGTVPVWVSEAMVRVHGMTPGREVALPFAPGVRFHVAAVWRDYARQHGAVAIDLQTYRRLTGDLTSSDVAVWIRDGADASALLADWRAREPMLERLELRSSEDIRRISLRIFDRSFAVTYLLEAIAIVVGLFGVATTFAGEALSRRREFGTLRHLGVTGRAVAAQIALEAAALVAVGVAWGAAVGGAIAWVLIRRVNPDSFHWTMDVTVPWGLVATTAAALVGLGVLVAWISARQASGQAPVQAVRADW